MEANLGNQGYEQFFAKADEWGRLWGIHYPLVCLVLLVTTLTLSYTPRQEGEGSLTLDKLRNTGRSWGHHTVSSVCILKRHRAQIWK